MTSNDPLEEYGTSRASSGASSNESSIWDKPATMDRIDDEAPEVDLALSPMLRRYPTFIPLRKRATSIASVAFLVPSSGSSLRRATVLSATFNMCATIVGGGVLSIPLSCARAGVLPFTALMIISALATDFSLYLLVSCSRRCGSTSYGNVARAAFGPLAEAFTTAVIFLVLVFTLVGLMVLNQGIWGPVVMASIASWLGEEGPEIGGTTMFQDAAVLLILLLAMAPFLLKRDLTSLRHICYVGFFSICVLCAAMVYRAAERNLRRPGLFRSEVSWTASSIADTLNALPIILCAFLCSFNIISVSCSLVDPTRERVRAVIHRAVFASFVLMYVFGLSGYLFAYERTDGNILLCFDPRDPLIFLGRIGCGIMTLFALPINALPCREALLSLAAQIGEAGARRGGLTEERRRLVNHRSVEGRHGGDADADNVREQEQVRKPNTMTSELKQNTEADEENGHYDGKNNVEYGTSASNGKGCEKSPRREQTMSKRERSIHRTATFVIVSICYVAAVLAPGVAIVWDISGSSMAFLIQFIIPSACYVRLKLRSTGRRATRHLVLAWLLLAFAVMMAVLCTAQVTLRLSGKLS